MRKVCWMVAAMLGLPVTSAFARPSDASRALPEVVKQQLGTFTKGCPKQKKNPAREAVRWYVWDEAQPPLVVLDVSKLPFSCGYAGTAGSPLMIYGNRNGRWVIAYDSFMAVRGFQLTTVAGSVDLALTLHHAYCDTKPGESCTEQHRLDTQAMQFILVSSSR